MVYAGLEIPYPDLSVERHKPKTEREKEDNRERKRKQLAIVLRLP
jgi:hypothetical protein